MSKNKSNVRKFTGAKVRSSDNVNTQKAYIARYMDFLINLGQSHYQEYLRGVNASKQLTVEEQRAAVKDLDLYSFVSGCAILGEILLTLNQTKFIENMKAEILKAMEMYQAYDDRYKVLIDYFLQHGKKELKKSPIEKDIDTSSFLSGFVYTGTNIFKGLVDYQLSETDKVYKEFISLANKKINLK